MNLPSYKFSIFTGLFQILLVILFSVCVRYNGYVKSDDSAYPFFQDIHVMIFIGFGFLMTFLKKYSFGAVGYNMFISALVIQWATLVKGWMHVAFNGGSHIIKVDLNTLVNSDFAAAAVLITFGAVLGKVSRLQLAIVGILEIIFYYINESIIGNYLQISDAGGSIIIHMFGAYFGIALARMIYTEGHGEENEKEGSVYHSDVFSMIGTIFLWLFWPSFNGGLLGPGSQQQRALINTYFSLGACCVTTFVISPLLNKSQKIDMVHVQNATLAGGVAVGTCADMVIQPWAAILIGVFAGIISTLGYAYVTPLLKEKLKIHDTCGVHNLHGMPAVFAAIAGAIAAASASLDTYGKDLFSIWPATTPIKNTTLYVDAMSRNIPVAADGSGRTASMQGVMQAVAIIVTLAISIVGGAITGLVIKFVDAPGGSQLYDDGHYWILPDDEEANPNESELLRQASA